MKLTDSVHLVGSGQLGFGISDPLDCHVYLVDGGGELALIDAGAGRSPEAIIANILADGLALNRLRYLLLTHAHTDHAGGAAALREQFDLEVLASVSAAEAVRNGDEEAIGLRAAREAGLYPPGFRFRSCPVDRELKEGDRVKVGARELSVIETPGHAGGHLAFLMSTGERTHLFCGDSLFFDGKLALQGLPDCDLQESLRSIRKLSTLSVDAFLPGHLCISLSDGQRHVLAAEEIIAALGVPGNIA